MATMTVTSKGQMTLPKEVRDDLKIRPGDKIDVVKEGGKYVLKPLNIRAVDLAGFLGKPPRGAGATVEDMDDAIAEGVIERFERAVRG